jgi:hypothetical protein
MMIQIFKRQHLTTIEPKDLIGRNFLKESEVDGQRFRARVVRAIIDKEFELKQNPEYVRFLCEVPKSTSDEILTYNEVLDHNEKEKNEKDNDTEQLWNVRRIVGHQGPFLKDHKGSTYNLVIEWENGESTYEPLHIIAEDDPVTVI